MTSENLRGALLDSDYFIALAFAMESTHAKALAMKQALIGVEQYVLHPILYELATVVSRKFSHALAMAIMEDVRVAPLRVLEMKAVESMAWEIFFAQRRKSTSFFDCANVAAARHYSLKIVSFDHFYPSALRFAL